MKKKFIRMVIYPKDVAKITGKSERYSRKLIQQIKINLNRSKNQFITIEEFCHFTGFNIELVKDSIID